MLAVKILGIGLVMVSTVLAGMYYGSINTFKINELSEMKRALSILRSEIEFCLNPLPQALSNIAIRTKQPINKFFTRLVQETQHLKTDSIATLWEEAVMSCLSNSYFDAEDLEHFATLGSTLGYLDKSMQFNSIRLTTDYIDSKIAALNEGRMKNRKMFQSLGVLSGVLVVVVLI